MDQRTTAYLNMAAATLQLLDQHLTEWNANVPAQRKVAALKTDYEIVRTAAQDGSTVTTGITDDKEAAGDAAIELAVKLARLTQSYALDNSNSELYQQMRVTASQLDDMADQKLVLKLRDLHQLMEETGLPLEEYGVTPAKLLALTAAIKKFDDMKTAPRLAVGSRSASNASLPEILRRMRVNFTILDNLVKGMDGASPAFVREYLSARNIINTGGRSGGGSTTTTIVDEPKP